MTRYLSGLSVAGLGLCGGGWLVVAALAFGGESDGRAGRVNLLTGAVLIAVGGLSLVCWSCAWRQRLRADGVLADRFPLVSRREARRNRRALSRDVRRAGKLAERSARDARRAARRSARLASGGALSEGGVLGEGVALGVASAGDEPLWRRRSRPRPPLRASSPVNRAAASRSRCERGLNGGPVTASSQRGAASGRRYAGPLSLPDLRAGHLAGRTDAHGNGASASGRQRSQREPGGARGRVDQRAALDAGAAAGRHRRPARARRAALRAGRRSLLRRRASGRRSAAVAATVAVRVRAAAPGDGRRPGDPRSAVRPDVDPPAGAGRRRQHPGPASDGEDAWW